MTLQLKNVEWDNPITIPSIFMTILMIVLSYSISIGIAWGFLTYVLGTIIIRNYNDLNIWPYILAEIFIFYLFFGI